MSTQSIMTSCHVEETKKKMAARPTGMQLHERCRKTKNSLDRLQKELHDRYFEWEKDEDEYGGVGGVMNECCNIERDYHKQAYFDFCKARGVNAERYPRRDWSVVYATGWGPEED